jgi:hypothetical protein
MQAKLIISFDALGEADFLAQAEGIAAALTGNAAFPEPWPSPLPGLTPLKTDIAAYEAAYLAAKAGDKAKIALREAARQTVNTDLKRLAPYLEMVANGDAAMLASSGYALRKTPVKTASSNPQTLPPPEDFQVSRGVLSGTIVIHASKLEGAGSYTVQSTSGDPTVEDNWEENGTYLRCSKIEIGGFTPGKVVSVRIRGIGTHSPGAWTPAASLMVV